MLDSLLYRIDIFIVRYTWIFFDGRPKTLSPKTSKPRTRERRDMAPNVLHVMHFRILAPASESLSVVVKNDTGRAPQERQTHVCHNRW